MRTSAIQIEPEGSLPREQTPVVRPKRHLEHVRELDGVRGIAALIVFFHHICFTSVPVAGWGRGVQLLSSVSAYGYVGVDLFFVLSGFLITSLLIKGRTSPRYYHDFYWKRALRILPLYVACLIGVLAIIPHSWAYVAVSALFIANFAWLFHIVSIGPFWTLAIEEQFYLIWPTVVRRRSIEIISRWAIWIGLSAVALRLIAACFGHRNYQFTFFHCDGLAAGAWLACCFERWSSFDVRSFKEKAVWVTGLALAILLTVLAFRIHGDGLRAMAFSSACMQTAITLFSATLIAFLLAQRGKPYLWIFRSRFLTFFGLISYAFYMIHLYVMFSYDHYRGNLLPGDVMGYSVRFFVVLGLTIALSLVSRYVLELPAASLRKYVLR